MTVTKDFTTEEVEDIIFNILFPLSNDEKEELRNGLTIEEYSKNQYIYRENEIPKCIKCLISGNVKVCKCGAMGRDQIIRTIIPNEFFAFRAYFAADDYLTSAIAFEHSIVASIPTDLIVKLMHKNFHISKYFIKQLAQKLGESDSLLVKLTQKHIPARLADTLLTLKDKYGLEEDGYTMSIYLSREELASMSNMTTSNAIRTLSQLASDKIIAIDGRKIKIINELELNKISANG